jgi:hypothetical protein
LIITFVSEKRYFSRLKLAKIAENCDHFIDPCNRRLGHGHGAFFASSAAFVRSSAADVAGPGIDSTKLHFGRKLFDKFS